MFFWNKANPAPTIDPDQLVGVNSQRLQAALSESDKGFDKGCFVYQRSGFIYGTDRVFVDDVEVLQTGYWCDVPSFRYTEIGLEMKEDLRDAINQLIDSHQIFTENKKNEDITKARTAVRNYLDEDFFD